MKMNYTNPHMTNEEIRANLTNYFDITKPDRYWDDLESSQAFLNSTSGFQPSVLSADKPSLQEKALAFQYGSSTDVIGSSLELSSTVQKTVQSQMDRHN